jgi:hypothetical protein
MSRFVQLRVGLALIGTVMGIWQFQSGLRAVFTLNNAEANSILAWIGVIAAMFVALPASLVGAAFPRFAGAVLVGATVTSITCVFMFYPSRILWSFYVPLLAIPNLTLGFLFWYSGVQEFRRSHT